MAKKRKLSDVDRLHQELFGTVLGKSGTAYEMLSAIVLATLGWKGVVHDRTERPKGRRADHQLDVTCHRDDGSVARLSVECKDWDTEDVGQDEMTKLWAVRDEIGASHAVMITKRAFTKGARDTAVDHDLAMIRLRVYDPAFDDGTWIRAATITLEIGVMVQENVELTLADGSERQVTNIELQGWMDVLDAANEPVGNVAGLFAAGELLDEYGDATHKRLQLDSAVRLDGFFDEPLWVTGMRWSERLATDTTVVTAEASGTPRLLLQQLDEDGNPYAGRVIVDEKLTAWRVEASGEVLEVKPRLAVRTLPVPKAETEQQRTCR